MFRHTEFVHDLLIGHLARLLLLSVSCLGGGVSLWSWDRIYHRPRVHLTQNRKRKNEAILTLGDRALIAFGSL